MSAAPFNPLLSVFSCATDPDPVADLPLSAIIDRIRSPELADISVSIATDFAAAGGGKAGKRATDAAKKRLPAVTLAGAFDRRANAAWREPSMLVQIDLDNLNAGDLGKARAELIACPWVACLWASPSGAGLKGAVCVPGLLMPDPSRYTVAWRAVSRWLASLGLVNDPAAKDAARLAFLAHDSEAWHNLEPQVFDLDRWTEPDVAEPPPYEKSRTSRTTDRNDPARIIIRTLAYVRAMPESVQDNNGSAALVAVMRTVRDGFDLSGADLWRVVDTWNAERANPPWNHSELEHSLESVEKVPPQRPRGWLLNADSAPWPALVPLDRANDPPLFDMVTMLPTDLPELSEMIETMTEAVQVPRELIASAAVGLAALACSRAVEVECASDWREPAPLWMMPLLRPGERKSVSVGKLVHPFHDWMAGERKRLAEPLARYAEKRRGMDARLCAVRARAAKEAAPEKRAKLNAEAADLAVDLEAMPVRIAAPELLAQSFTPEGLRDALEANGEKLGIVSAEADAGELLGSRYSDAGPNLDLLLCAHAGDAITTRRAGGRVVPLERPAVGMVLAVQPEAVRAVLADRAAKGRGLIDRMLLLLPPSRLGFRLLDPKPVPRAVSEWWAAVIGRTLDLPWPGRCIVGHDGEPVRCTSAPRMLTIDPGARCLLWRLRAELEPRLAEGADLAAVSGFASKLPGACARIALAFTILRDPQADRVSEAAMRAACAWAPFLLAHHRAVLGDAAEKPEAHHARRLWRALIRRGHPIMTARDLFDLVRDSAVPDMAAFRPVLLLLAEHGAVRAVTFEHGRPGRQAERWEIHPDLLAANVRDMRDIPMGMEGAA